VPSSERPGLRVTALAISAQLGGTERVLLDFAERAFESDIALRVLTPRDGPLIRILNELGIPAQVVEGPETLLRGSQRLGALTTVPAALLALRRWSRRLADHPYVRDAAVLYSVSFKTHLATLYRPVPAVERLSGRAVERLSGSAVGGPAVVWHLHEFPPTATGVLWKMLARRKPDALIANSRAVATAWGGREPLNRSPAQPPVSTAQPLVVPNGVDLDRFRPRDRSFWIHDRLGIPREDRLIGMPAVLARWKGQLEVIEAFSRVAGQFPEAHLVLVGGNIYDTAAETRFQHDLARELERRRAAGLTQVHQLPFQAKVELVYPELDAAVHYSRRPEAFGRVVLEAMACGVPVLAAAEGGPREILTEGGWLVPPRQPPALAAALASALTLPSEALREVGRQGRLRAEDRYSARRFARDVAEVLKGVQRTAHSSPLTS
jgi:glycosyltransferase involved in cell wall biosynthesis